MERYSSKRDCGNQFTYRHWGDCFGPGLYEGDWEGSDWQQSASRPYEPEEKKLEWKETWQRLRDRMFASADQQLDDWRDLGIEDSFCVALMEKTKQT